MPRRKKTVNEFWAMAEVFGECWIFPHSSHVVHPLTGVRAVAPRIAWTIVNGDIPEGLEVCHNCPDKDHRRCINPSHLWLGTHQENMQDAARKGMNSHNKGCSQFTYEQRQDMRALYATHLYTRKSIADIYNCSLSTVANVLYYAGAYRDDWPLTMLINANEQG